MNIPNKPIKKVVIAGGGTAGWMTAAALTKLLGKNLEVVLVESDEIGTVGVGEATIPTLHIFHRLLGIKEQDVMAATNATFKLGISFENWHDVGKDYIHSFGFLGKDCWACGFQHFWLKGQQRGLVSEIGDYCTEHLAAREGRFAVLPNQDYNHAYHMDASLYAKFLRVIAEQHGIKRIEGKISAVQQHHDNGHISALTLMSGEVIEGDLFIDCTGFKALLIEQTLNAGFDDWSHWLPCDSAIAVQTKTTSKPIPYTRSIARESGWQWRIPLQSRTGNGIVFCSKYISDDEAKATLMENIEGEPLTEPRVIKFRTGSRRKTWDKNCVAIGLSSGFLEPLESTSIHLIQRGIVRLLQMFPSQGIVEEDINEFNQQTRTETENIRDFIILHYKVTDRVDTRFWRHCKSMDVPASLQHRIDMFDASGKVYKHGNELFGESSWIQVMMGQGLAPKQYHPIVDMMEDAELESFLGNIKAKVKHKVANLPDHYEFVQHYCKSKML
ncbi:MULTISPECIES: tryptophan halogenase family protein [unclassified Shewanella]|uniref:tryptophan halogenase family protein n=1 Tax=unclassified Shewanella TaxID=196818 RepID=UPI000C84596F|nr:MULTISPECIES: tryptophan halogenase family protein [unclassified Shewanella]MDO6619584.1 tryptophan 7-halogenase [Shewanella sp. 6_MG-2023]MDO6680238.1 tryptophan 7-halogenase [Shewanella sp. 4_MG-2023]MDO6775879.1 tryptophan 7-halogenase [Shewanella sp. 3_MG-2023]PMG29741.1 tryptophan halogenase [Shewanella sp. 10N.286.52.C2]PMG42869.1 tryptophan halogenase [Shewanella sp. 10N.286.52.B9]